MTAASCGCRAYGVHKPDRAVARGSLGLSRYGSSPARSSTDGICAGVGFGGFIHTYTSATRTPIEFMHPTGGGDDCRFRPKRVRAQLRSRRPEWQPRALGRDSQMALCARLPAGLARPGPGSGCPHLSPGEGCRLPVACVSDSTASLRQTPRVSFDEQPRCEGSPRLPGATAPRRPERVDGLLAPGGAGIRRRERRRTVHSGPGRRRALCHGR